jgi:hypothetical protein
VKTLLDETDSWVWERSKTTCGIYGEMDSKTFNETNKKRNEKMTSNLLYPQKTMDCNKMDDSAMAFQPLRYKISHING